MLGPSPCAGRAIHGFVMLVMAAAAGTSYLFWAVLPHELLHTLCPLDIFPQRQWALIVPTLLMLALILLVCFYPFLGMLQSPAMDSVRVLRDEYSREPRDPQSRGTRGSVPPPYDLDPGHVCRVLYGGPVQE